MKIEHIILIFFIFTLVLIPVNAQNITSAEALQALQQAEQDIAELSEAGFSIDLVNDTLTQAKLALERADFAQLIRQNTTGELAEKAKTALEGLDYEGFTYNNVLEYTREIAERKQQAYQLKDSIRASELEMKSYQEEAQIQRNQTTLNKITGFFVSEDLEKELVDISEAENLLKEARKAFQEERSAEANELLSQAQKNLEEKRAEITTAYLLTQSSKSFIEKNLPVLIMFTIVLVLSGYFTRKKIKLKMTKNKLEKMKIEKKAILNLMKKAQTDRFKKAILSASIYNIKMEKYNQRLNEIKQTLPVLSDMLKKK